MQYLIFGDRYDGKEDFAVVLQPFLHNFFIPHTGVSDINKCIFKQSNTSLWRSDLLNRRARLTQVSSPSTVSTSVSKLMQRWPLLSGITWWVISSNGLKRDQHFQRFGLTEFLFLLYQLEPVGRKQAYNNFTHDRSKIHCPSEVSAEVSLFWRNPTAHSSCSNRLL